MATTLSDKVGIVVPLDSHVAYTARMVRSYGMENLVAGIRGIGVYGLMASSSGLVEAECSAWSLEHGRVRYGLNRCRVKRLALWVLISPT